jgi:hypothetical protein
VATLKAVDCARRARVAKKSSWGAVDLPDAALFRSLSRGGTPTARRLDTGLVGCILKSTLRHAQADDMWALRIAGRVSDFGSRRLWAGFVTTACAKSMPEWQLQKVTCHKSTALL